MRYTFRLVLLRSVGALLALIVGVGSAGLVVVPAADAAPKPNPNYPIDRFAAGEQLLMPLLMWRWRHTVMTDPGHVDHPDDWAGYGRNVADAHWQTEAGGQITDWYVVMPSVNGSELNTKVANVDIFQFNRNTGLWRLVNPAGEQLTEGGKAVVWDQSSTPSFKWNLLEYPDLAQDLKVGRTHSEPNLRYFLDHMMDAKLHLQVDEVGSEKMFCSGPSDCVNQLKRTHFPNLKRGVVLTSKPSRAMIGRIAYPRGKDKDKVSEEKKQEARQKLKDKLTSDDDIEQSVKDWDKQGRPVAAGTRMAVGGNNFGGGSGNAPAQGPAVLSNAGTGGAGDPGGIDFTSLQLRYLSESPGGDMQYAYSASPAGPGAPPDVAGGRLAMAQMSDAFYVWLNLPASTFWVNLNPNEPDRIVDKKLGATDVGRIMLQADLNMKKMSARLTNPNTDLGQQFWGPPDPNAQQECVVTRQWIVPKPASVYEADGGIYIIDAPLEVKAESEMNKGVFGDPSCPAPSDRMERVFEQLILPKVEDAVNHAPEFAELRRVYLARVAAEWYRQRHTGALAPMIDSGDVHRWPALQSWSPKTVFDDYVKSYRDHEYNVTKTVDSGNYRYTFSYSDGGVDFGKVPFATVPKNTFQQQYSDVSKAVGQSFQQRTPDAHNRIWLGATAKVKEEPLDYTAGDDGYGEDGPVPDYALEPGLSYAAVTGWSLLAILVLFIAGMVTVVVLNVRASQRRRLAVPMGQPPRPPMPPGLQPPPPPPPGGYRP
ncbi:hypothetical protein ACPPVO_39365 [Dactylosporangium sp. McL0621]|uniref:hypothetical protein n=1 Tax=Dactylosporangium sp. McL0621 TaxID=3415678 RepID=UPI003CF62FCD